MYTYFAVVFYTYVMLLQYGLYIYVYTFMYISSNLNSDANRGMDFLAER